MSVKRNRFNEPPNVVPKPRKSRYLCPEGWHDVLPDEGSYYEYLRSVIRGLAEPHGYVRLEPALVETKELANKTLGKDPWLSGKGMLNLAKRGGDLVLRPHYTIGMIRAFGEHDLGAQVLPQKIYSMGPVFRESESGGRTETVAALEIIGNDRPATDAEVVQLLYRICERLGVAEQVEIHLSSAGCAECWPTYRQSLKDYYRSHRTKLCSDCRKSFAADPRNLLACREEKCKRFSASAPQAVDGLCDACRKHFQFMLESLDNLDIPYVLDHRLVGAGYANRTLITICHCDNGNGAEIMRGERHDLLMRQIGGQVQGAVGAEILFMPLINILKKRGPAPALAKPKVFLAQLSELAKKKSMILFEKLFSAGIPVYEAFGRDSIKAQLRLAQQLGVEISLILGHKEAVEETILMRDMKDGVQEVVAQEKLIDVLKKKLSL